MGVMVSSSHAVSAAPSSSGGGLLTLCLCCSMGPLPWETVFHELFQRGSFPRAAALHELLRCGSLPWSAVLQEQAAPAWFPLASQPPLGIHGLQVEICSAVDLHELQGHSLPHLVFSMGCRGISAPACGAHPPPPSSLTLVSAGLFLSHVLNPLFQLQLRSLFFLFPP